MQAPRLSEVTLRGSWLRHVVRQEGLTQTRTRKLTVPVSRSSISCGTLRQEALVGVPLQGACHSSLWALNTISCPKEPGLLGEAVPGWGRKRGG